MPDLKTLNIPSDLTKDEIAEIIGKLTDQMKTAPDASNEVYIWAIIDRSGSMGSVVNDSIGGFNSFLKEQVEAKDGKAFMSVLLFDNLHEEIETMKPVEEVKPLTLATYTPRGSTSLYDAIGKTLNKATALNKKNNIIVILTDGEENTSTEFNLVKIKEMTGAAETRGWRFVYLAANQDAFAVSRYMGMNLAAAANFAADGVGTKSAYATASSSTINLRSTMTSKSN